MEEETASIDSLPQTKEELGKVLMETRRTRIDGIDGLELVIREAPQQTCGSCAYYKTPRCTFASDQAYIKKTDKACADFFPDRHISREKLRKPKRVMMKLGKR